MAQWQRPWHLHASSLSKVTAGCDTSFVATDIYFSALKYSVFSWRAFPVRTDIPVQAQQQRTCCITVKANKGLMIVFLMASM